jgi:hypothetical protein
VTDPATPTTCTRPTCDKPAHDFYLCRDCAYDLSHTMESVPWMLSELDLVTALQTRYTNGDGRGGSDSHAVMDFTAADARRRLCNALGDAAAAICKDNGWGIAVNWHDPRSASQAASWIHWRISAVRLYPEAATITDAVLHAYANAVHVIDRPESRQYLGDCETMKTKMVPCPGRIYGRAWRTWAACNVCGLRWDVTELRAYLIASLTDRLCTAAEIADLGAYLNLSLTRDQTRKRLNQWHRRGTLPASGNREGSPTFRFGNAHDLLARYELTA